MRRKEIVCIRCDFINGALQDTPSRLKISSELLYKGLEVLLAFGARGIHLVSGQSRRNREEVANVKRECFAMDHVLSFKTVKLARETVEAADYGSVTFIVFLLCKESCERAVDDRAFRLIGTLCKRANTRIV
ncbi:MAG: hypothetical protein AAF269_06960 [Pseudomonadota bacterium]